MKNNKKNPIENEKTNTSSTIPADVEIKPDPTVSVEAFKGLMEKMESLEKDRDILMESADKKALSRYYSRHKSDLPSIVNIRSIRGKVILGWRMVEDRGSYQIPGTKQWTEHQIIEVIFQDGTKKQMSETEFERSYEKNIKAKVIATNEDKVSGELSLKLERTDNGEEITLGVAFVN